MTTLKIKKKLDRTKQCGLQTLAKVAINNRNESMPEWKDDAVFVYTEGCETHEHVRRWMVNFLRHGCTAYDAQLDARFGMVGVQDAHDLLQAKINQAAEVFIRHRDRQ